MINKPITVVRDDFQDAWLEAVRYLMDSHWELRNLVVQTTDPRIFDQTFHAKMEAFAKGEGILGPKHVAYTIFPHGLYKSKRNARRLFVAYNREGGLFDRVKTGWGTYFRRMTSYETPNGVVNQLDNIIKAIRSRRNFSKAAYTIIIQTPGGETVRPLGGPCLNYIAIQADAGQGGTRATLGLMAVYRNHDFLKRAYGNYWGLCNLLLFLTREVNALPGPLTCVSSHAYVDTKKAAIKRFVESL